MITAVVSIRVSPCGGRMLCVINYHGYDAAPAPGARTVGFKGSRPSAAAPCAQAHGSSDCAYLNKQKAEPGERPSEASLAVACAWVRQRAATAGCAHLLVACAIGSAEGGRGRRSREYYGAALRSRRRRLRPGIHDVLIQFRDQYNNKCMPKFNHEMQYLLY